jgi:NAD(P)-dependent dehydrogenase (short-subunit alcohol dehydrogenase family)
MMFDLSRRVALVTGAGQGVGAGIARALAAQGAAVAVNDLHAERADQTAGAIRALGGKAHAVVFDVTDRRAVEGGVRRIEAALRPVDVLVNNAGVPEGMTFASFAQMDPSEWRRYIDLNMYGVFNCTKAVIAGMCARAFGRVITISSAGGLFGSPLGISLYGASKGGAIAFMRHLAMEVAGSGVTANTLALGLMANMADKTEMAAFAQTVPGGRVGTPEDAGAAVVYLASDEAGFMTGQTIVLNGGSQTT